MNKPSAIFKYFTEERIDLLSNGLIRYTQPKDFNDPFETFPYFLSMGPHNDIDAYAESFDSDPLYYKKVLEETLRNDPRFKSMPPQLQNLMREFSNEGLEILQPGISLQVKNFFKSAMKFEGAARPLMIETVLKSINMAFGILCFTQRKDNLLMWSHYSNSHKGFVLEFFPEHNFFDNRETQNQIAGHLKEVRYTLKRPEFSFFDPAFSQREGIQATFRPINQINELHVGT